MSHRPGSANAAARWGWRMAKRWYLAALMPYLISFAFIGQIESFDIVWMLLFPPIAAFLVERPRSLILWDATFLALVTGVYTLPWTRLYPLMYTNIALTAQLTALSFLAVISWFMQGLQGATGRRAEGLSPATRTLGWQRLPVRTVRHRYLDRGSSGRNCRRLRDALPFKRAYKLAWADERIPDLFAAERGRQFDPDLTDLFLGHYADFVTLRDRSG